MPAKREGRPRAPKARDVKARGKRERSETRRPWFRGTLEARPEGP